MYCIVESQCFCRGGETKDLKDNQNEQLQNPSCSSNSEACQIINDRDKMVMNLSSDCGDGSKSDVCGEGDLNGEGDVDCEADIGRYLRYLP